MVQRSGGYLGNPSLQANRGENGPDLTREEEQGGETLFANPLPRTPGKSGLLSYRSFYPWASLKCVPLILV